MEIYKKLFEVKSHIGKISKDSNNPFFKSKYFDVNSLLENVEPLLHASGLLLLQPITDNKVLTQIIDIETGESVTSSMELPNLADPQKIGSAITYFRRYTLQSLLGIQAEDDDANKASGNKTNTLSKQEDNRPWLNEKQFNQALEKIAKGEPDIYNKINTAFRMKKEYREELTKVN